MIAKKLFVFLEGLLRRLGSLGNFFIKGIKNLILDVKKDLLVRKAQREMLKVLNNFKSDFEKLINQYYDFLPLPHGKSIIENKLKNGKIVYFVVFNDSRKRTVTTIEIYYEDFISALPKQYELLQRINMDVFLGKVKENVKNFKYRIYDN